jgi:hypothetical protein
MATKIQGGSSTAGLQNVDAYYQALVKTANPVETNGTLSPSAVGSVRLMSETDAGTVTGTASMLSPETDDDYRLRVAHDTMLDWEEFNYASQNTGKHTFTFTTLAATMTTAGITTNSSQVNTTGIGLTFGTFANFPMFPTQTITCETSISFTAQPTSNLIFDFGMFQRGASTAFAPTDGIYFRLSSAGLQGVTNYNGTETTTSVFPAPNTGGTGTWTYTNNTVYKFLIQTNNSVTSFWANNILLGTITQPIANMMPCMSAALPWSFRHANTGTTGDATFRALVRDYKIGLRGKLYAEPLGSRMNAVIGSYQGLSGGTMGTNGTYANNTNPTAAVPTNTTAAVGAVGLLNQAWETFSLAVNTDGIILSYQVPAGTVSVQGRRLKVTGVKLASFVQTVLAGGPISRVFSLAFGGTTVTQATAESASMASATAKARRIVLLPELTQHVTAAQAVNTAISQPGGTVSNFTNPIYVNPGEFVQVIVKGIGTVGTSGTIVNHIQLDYSWE